MRNVYIYSKNKTLCKKHDNLRYVFIYKKSDTLRSAIFHEIFEIGIYCKDENSDHIFRGIASPPPF